MKKNIKLYISLGLLCLFVILTILLKTVDVRQIGPFGTAIGLGGINSWFKNLISDHIFFYLMTEFYGYITIGFACLFVILAIILVIVRKSFKKLDKEFYVLFGLYAITIGLIALFKYVFVINYRPYLIDYDIVVSFPVFQVLIAVVVYFSSSTIVNKLIKDKDISQPINIITYAFVGLIVVACIISGCSWLTDIIASLLLGFSLALAFQYVCEKIGEKQNENK